MEWRGKIQDVVSAEVRYFRDWYSLVSELQTLLSVYYDSPDAPVFHPNNS